ncbi:MAG TPA: hypothetical protein VKP68_13860 [Ramlibacter sp.]|nr:hypothetical protein [Ramlibacter sp.]
MSQVRNAMRLLASLLQLLCVLAASLSPQLASAEMQTVCTITVNSADEQESFRRFLPASKYRFVELVERHRPDWLASACQQRVSCDVLVISGHYGAGNEFFSDALEAREFLPIAELERVSCSDSCPSLFSRLKEVYLFGCNTLNPQAQHSASAEIARSLVREGSSPVEADRLARLLNSGHGESSRDRMRMVFKDVPVIYGFSSAAPLGPAAASTLNRYFQATGAKDVGNGRASSRLLSQFAPNGMTVAQGMTDADPHAAVRQDMCRFADDRLSNVEKLRFVHQILQRPTAEARMLLDRIERYAAGLDASERQAPEVAQELDAIARDAGARGRYLAFARDADEPAVRARMLNLAHDLGWLSTDERRHELVRMTRDLLAHAAIAGTEVDLVCTLNKEHDLDGGQGQLAAAAGGVDDVGHAAIRACMGSAEGHARTLQGLVSPADADVRIAQTYLHHRPIVDVGELRAVVAAIARMNGSEAQVRALDALAQHYLSDRESLDMLATLYSQTPSWPVQNAIAGILIRSDTRSIGSQDLLRTLRERRHKPPSGDNMVDALISRLQLP